MTDLIDNTEHILESNKIFRCRHKGERCFILGTGPSIKEQNLKFLAGETCIALSNFFVHPDYNMIKPYYHCIASHHPPITEEAWQAWMKEVAERTGDAGLFFSLSDKQRVEANEYFANRQVHYLAFDTPEQTMNSIVEAGIELTRPIFPPQSVSVMALALAIYMEFEEIYLLGCDHDWICHMHESKHFYEEIEHAMARYGYNEWKESDVELECICLINLWRQYKILNLVARLKGIKIFNATHGGLLDVFPRTCFEKLFEQKTSLQTCRISGDYRRHEDMALPLTPISRVFGLDRGSPIDRYYIERFLEKYSDRIYGDVLEVGDSSYTRKFGSTKVRQSMVLDATSDNPQATIIGNLETGEGIPAEIADCFILTQVLPCIFDVRSAAYNAVKALKPGGHLLVTVPGITPISRFDMDRYGFYWNFTDLALRKLFEGIVPKENISIEIFGNVMVAAAFLYGFAQHELLQKDLDYLDQDYQVIITALVEKPLS